MPRALVSLCGFKGFLTNREACEAVALALEGLGYETDRLPIGDGGAGSLWTVQSALGGSLVEADSSGPQGRPTRTRALLLENALYIESSETCGHGLVPPGQKNALRATSFGLGRQILALLDRYGAQISTIYVGLGDSAISDMGMGLIAGLGGRFYNTSEKRLPADAAHLGSIARWDGPMRTFPKFVILCDVDNPLCGPRGSARTFAPQKGATPEDVRLIEAGMEHFADLLENKFGRSIKSEPRTGSAGGLSSIFRAFFDAELVPGAAFLLNWVNFDKRLNTCSVLVTGEGKTDAQTLSGKAPFEALQRARKFGKRSVLLSGLLGEGYEKVVSATGAESAHATGAEPNAFEALQRKTREVFKSRRDD